MSGWIKLHRQILKSDIWSKPSLYLKVWIYLLLEAQHQNYKNLKCGQLRTSIPEIQEAMSYMVGYRRQKPSRKQVWDVLEWLRSSHAYENRVNGTVNRTRRGSMIETTKVTHGILVNVVNYELYQGPENNEGNNEGNNERNTNGTRTEQRGNNINKNVKNVKNDKKETYTCVFEEFWKEYPRKIGKKNAFRIWNARLKEKHDPENIILATKNYAKYCKQNNTETKYIKHPSTFIGTDKPFEEFLKPMKIDEPQNSWSHQPDYTFRGKRPEDGDKQDKKTTKATETSLPNKKPETIDPNLVDKLIKDTAAKLSEPALGFEKSKAKFQEQWEKIKQREKIKPEKR